jgi:hypothetical protein
MKMDHNEPKDQLPILSPPEISTPEFVTVDMFNELQLELQQLRAEFAVLRNDVVGGG